MKVDCQWIEENLEALSSDRLSPEDDFHARTHLESCSHCREKLADLKMVDPLVKQLFRQNLAIARTPRRRRSPVLIGAFGTGLVAIILLIVISAMPRGVADVPRLQSPPAVASLPGADGASIPKVGEPGTQDRTKPETAAPDRPLDDTSKPAVSANAPEFLVVDPAGYSRTLVDFRDHVLIFGVWTASQPQTISSLQRVYETFSRNTKLRILGVAAAKEAKPAATTFPIAYNQGSTLLGAKSAEFLIVDGKGVVRARGSLLGSPANVVSSIRSTLNQLGIN
jgi:hypothetical protein